MNMYIYICIYTHTSFFTHLNVGEHREIRRVLVKDFVGLLSETLP